MQEADWKAVIDQAGNLGVGAVQFIGGEPTLHPSLPTLVRHARQRGIGVEVYTNLVHVTTELWDTFAEQRVSLATSYYSDDPAQHNTITRRSSHPKTRTNIAEALRRGIPLRVGIIGMSDAQRTDGARRELRELGVPDDKIGYDRLRQVGRGIRDQQASADQLCGNCTNGVLAILADGSIAPCVFARWPAVIVGNVQSQGGGNESAAHSN